MPTKTKHGTSLRLAGCSMLLINTDSQFKNHQEN